MPSAHIGQEIRKLTGAHTRIVWSQQQKGSDDWQVMGDDFKLMGVDSDDGRGVRRILEKTGSFSNPMMTPSGKGVVYTDNTDRCVYYVNFDGTGLRRVTRGYAIAAWKNPGDGIEWVYVRPNNAKSWISKSRPVVRHRLDAPRIKETVWTERNVTWNYFQLSPDGKRAAACMHWPMAGMATLPNGRFRQFDKGCWTCMAPDNSYRMWVFDGDHRHVKVYDKKGKLLWRLVLNGGPGIKGWEIYYPRWSNNVRFVTVAGPCSKNRSRACRPDEHENLVMFGGRNVDLYIGRLSKNLKKVEAWVRVTKNDKADFHGDAWIDPGTSL